MFTSDRELGVTVQSFSTRARRFLDYQIQKTERKQPN